MIKALGCTCAVLAVCGLALTAQAQSEGPHQAYMAANLIQQTNVKLANAIQTAEQQTGGRAISADAFVPPPWQTGGTEQLKYAITTVSGDNPPQLVFIDGQTGRVEHVQPAMVRGVAPAGRFFGGNQSSGMQSGTSAGQPTWQPGNWPPSGEPWSGQRPPQGMYGPRGEWQPGYGGSQLNQPPGPWGEQPQWRGQPGPGEGGFEAQRFGEPMQGGMMAAPPELASQIIGAMVQNNENQKLGRIDDLAVNENTGRVPFAILNLNDKLYPIPFRLVHVSGQDQVALNISKDRVENLPTLNKTDWPQTVNSRLAAMVNSALGLQQGPGSEFEFAGFRNQQGNTPPGAPSTQPSGGGAQPGQPGFAPIRKASDLMDKNVQGPQGEPLGTIKDLVLDPNRSRLAYVVVSFKNMGDKFVAVPWEAFNVQQNQIVLNANQNRLQQSQSLGFAPDNWPDMSNPEWAQREAEIWGTQPYPMMGHGMMGGSQMHHRQGGQQPQQQWPGQQQPPPQQGPAQGQHPQSGGNQP